MKKHILIKIFLAFVLILSILPSLSPSKAEAVTVSSELKSIKSYAHKGTTPYSKKIKIGSTPSQVKSKFGKPNSLDYYRDNVVAYVYKNKVVDYIFFNGKASSDGEAILYKGSKVGTIESGFNSKESLTYAQIKKVFGSKPVVGYDSIPERLFITYDIGKYSVTFRAPVGKYSYDDKLINKTVFDTYTVTLGY